ncbi:YitT family protein [Paenibacillus camelliae]|uniref:YitT family protein n=1 Tax=Paenibacillus camelliae TaxID=512410 RepID=UPI00203E9C15|nr:YitT family protein [Paenibacillus camelliae]MCM3635939.1 YitT family protein [Paenibacillus camelliae]
MKRNRKTLSPTMHIILNIAQVLLGSFILATSFNLFLLPNGIASGGVAGISVLVERVAGVQPAVTQWVLNIPLFLAAIVVLGKKFGAKSILGSVVFPLFVLLTSYIPAPTHNPLLAAIYGGIGVGLGLATVFRGGGSTGGLDLAAQMLHKLTGIPYHMAVICFDGAVIIGTAVIISPEVALYALISLFVTSKTIDFAQNGLQLSKVAFIISDRTAELQPLILNDLDRGLTNLKGEGGYTGQDRNVMMVVVSQHEVVRLKKTVARHDPNAFIIISNTAEVFGKGFKTYQ